MFARGGARRIESTTDRFPEPGSYDVIFRGARYLLSARRAVGGRAISVFARELGGPGIVSFNAYAVRGQWQVKPCEMALSTVEEFLAGYGRPD